MTIIVIKNSSTASAVPTTSDLVQGELAVNVTDKRIFTENASTQIVELGTNPSTITTATATVTGTLTANGTFASSNAVLTGGTVNGVVIGATTPLAITGTNITATTGFVGGLTGNVTGNVTGNLTGNVTGDLTGNVVGNVIAVTGTTTLNNLIVNGTADFTNTKLVNVTTPVAGTDAANKTYVDDTVAAVIDSAPAALDTLNELAAALGDDANFASTVTTALATKLPLAGGTMTGAIAMGTAKITGLGDPTAAQDAATKAYVDTQDATKLSTTGGTMSGAIAMGTNKITGLGTPTNSADAATKAYTDSILGSATSAADSAAAAATSASNASTSASNAASSATTASNAVTAAELAATNAAASYDSFDDRYLGAKASDPTLDNDGDALIAGATYFNTSTNSMKVYSGSAWSDVAPVATSVTLSQVTDFPSQSGQSGKYLSTNGTTPSWETLTTDPTLGTLTKTFTTGESSTINLSSSVLAPVISVTKEIPQSGVTNNSWDVNSTTENYTRLDSAYDTTLDFVGFDVSVGVLGSNSFNFSSQEASVQDITFNADGTKVFIVGAAGDAVYEYTLSTSFDVSTATFVDSFSVASQESTPTAVQFNNDGTKMFVVGTSNSVYEYDLSTGFDVSTSVFSQSFSVASQESNSFGLAFNTDGTKMFVVGTSGDDVNEYTLSTGFDVSTASFVDSFSVSSQENSPQGITFNNDGTKMFICGTSGDDINEYTLSTGFDVSTASFVDSFSVASQETSPRGLAFDSNGIKMFVVGNDNNTVYEYSTISGLALGTGSFASADVGKTIEANSGVFVLTATDGSYVETTAPTSYDQVASGDWSMYGVVYNAADGDLELSGYLSLYNNISSTTYTSSVSAESGLFSLYFKPDGLAMFIMSSSSVYSYNLSTAWDVTTAVSTGSSYSFAAQVPSGGGYGLVIGDSGTKMYLTSYGTHNIYQYSLSTAWDITSASFTKSQNTPTNYTDKVDLAFNPDGTKLYVVRYSSDQVVQISLTTAWDVASMTGTGSVVLDTSSEGGAIHGVAFNSDGTKVYVSGIGTDIVYEYSLSTAYDFTGASYSGNSFDLQSQVNTARSIRTAPNGLYLYVADSVNGRVYQYSTGVSYFSTGYQPVHTTTSIDSTYWTDINSMTADQAAGDGNVYYAISTDDRTTWTVIDNTDGERDIVRNNGGTWQYNSNGTYASETWTNGTTNTELATLAEAMEGAEDAVGFVLANTTFVDSFNFSSEETGPNDAIFNNDGTKMFVTGQTGDDINEYTLSTAYDVSTATFVDSFSVAAKETNPMATRFNADGTKMFVVGTSSDSVHEYSLSTGFDVSTATFSQSFSVASQTTYPTGLAFNSDGTKMFVNDGNTPAIEEYSLSTGFDISTASFTTSFSTSGQDSQPQGLTFNADGTKMYHVGITNDKVFEYTLTTGFDISTASFTQDVSIASQDDLPRSVSFNADGTNMYVVGISNTSVYEYTTSSVSYTNQMDKTQLDAVTDPNHIALGNDLDLAIVFNMTSGSTVPSSDGVAINYDANVLNKGAVLGTDYDFDAPTTSSVRITALAGNNLKVRVV